MMRRRIYAFVMSAVVAAPGGAQQTRFDAVVAHRGAGGTSFTRVEEWTCPVAARVHRVMARYGEIGQLQGAWLVADSSGVVARGAYGEADRAWGVPNTPNTKFNLGSLTKQFTAALVLSLVDDGLVHPDSTLSAYLPEYREDVGRSVTVHDLLTHRGGFFLPRMSRDEYDAFFRTRHTSEEIVAGLTGADPRYPPDTRFAYSSAGYIVLGAIIERVTGLGYGEALRRRLLEPLGMHDTGVDDNDLVLPRRAAGYQTNYGWGNAAYKYYPNSFASGALYSTVEDLHRWDRALREGEILSDEGRRLLFRRHTSSHRGFYGYGWFLADQPAGEGSVPVAFHAGDNSGFSSIVLRSLDEAEQFVALLTNTEGTHYYDIAFNILSVLNGAEAEDPLPYVADVLRRAVYTGGMESASSRFEEMQRSGLDAFNTDEPELLELVGDLLYAGRAEDAVQVARMTGVIHPESPEASMALGEALERADDPKGALEAFERVLTLRPNDDAAAAAVRRLGRSMASSLGTGGADPAPALQPEN
jgi:CubicO group peptidase (beta-lactamase class C family)